MDNVIWLILAATVGLVVAVSAIYMATNGLNNLGQSSESTKTNSICSFQWQQVQQGNAQSVDPKCQSYARKQQYSSVGSDLCASGVIC